jgi:hypothetical protein
MEMMSGIGPVYPPPTFTTNIVRTHDYHTSKFSLPIGRNPVQVQGQAFRESVQYSNLTLLNQIILGHRLPRNVVSQRALSNFRLFTHNGPLNG